MTWNSRSSFDQSKARHEAFIALPLVHVPNLVLTGVGS